MRYNNQDLIDCGDQMFGIKDFGGCTLSEYHKYLLKLLSEVDRICRKNNIQYFLMYGTLIGAVRHHGFVPWDDDADIAMKRSDFIKFSECCKKELGEEFDLVTYNDDENYNYTFPKLRLKNTTYIIRSEISRHGRNAGFFIDIMIMDYVPENKFKAYIQKRTLMALHRLVSPGFVQSNLGLNSLENIAVSLSKTILGKKTSIKIAEKIITSVDPEQSSALIANIFLPTVNYFYVYDKHHFEKSYGVPFENTILQVPADPITLLHKCYFKIYIEKNILIEHKYEDEIKVIINNQLFYGNDIMFIPNTRERDRHLEIIFDCNHGSSYYDDYYFKKFNKKENDKCAIIDRKCREKGRDALAVMNENELIAKQACCELLFCEYFREMIVKYPEYSDVALKEAIIISDKALQFGAIFSDELNKEELVYLLNILIKSGVGFDAKRLAYRLLNMFSDIDLSNELKLIDDQLDAFYSIFTKDLRAINRYIENDYNDFFSILLKGIVLYWNNNVDDAKKCFINCLNLCDSAFWAHYYLGIIEMDVNRNYIKAKGFFVDAMNDTTFMPQLQLAINKIEEIDTIVNEKVVNC